MRDRALVGFIILAGALSVAATLQPGQSEPKRLYSIGDSITRAFDADLIADQLHLSWVNGYHGFWEELLNLPDINAHNQRITNQWGSGGRENWIAAENGARVDDMASQASGLAGKNANYVTVMLGGNDVCRDEIADLPTNAEFEANVRAGFDTLLSHIGPGASVLVSAIPDVKQLYDIGQDKTILGIVNCETLWELTVLGFPCGSMLSSENSEADRLYVQSRNVGYNDILAQVTVEKAAQNPDKFIRYSSVVFDEQFLESDISDLDCFHPSWRGQKRISEGLWLDGPFNQVGCF